MNLSGKWTGFFQLDESYGPVLKGKKGYFELEITDVDGMLTGHCIDTHGFGVKEIRKAKIEGNVNNGWVSFKKVYDNAIPIDAFGSDISDAHFDSQVIYDGIPDQLVKTVKGNWKISMKENPNSHDDYVTGKWEMNRV